MTVKLRAPWLHGPCHAGPPATRKSWLRIGILAAGGFLAVGGCSSSSSGLGFGGSAGDNASTPTGGGASSSGGGGETLGASDDAGAVALPAEMKVENAYQSPVSTGQIVWIADPTSGRVAYIDAKTFAVQTVAAGNAPTYIAAVPDPTDDVAIVQNILSHDATLLRVHAGQISAVTYPSTPDANAWAVSAKGRWAIAWTNAAFEQNADPTQGFQDLEVIDLSGKRAPIVLNVGYRPSQVVFSGDESRAYAVTQDGLSVLDLTAESVPTAIGLYPLATAAPPPPPVDAGGSPEAATGDGAVGTSEGGSTQDANASDASQPDVVVPVNVDAGVTASTTPDVSFTPDAAYALVRLDGYSAVTVVSMLDGTSVAVTLPSPPTDLTVSPTGDFAIAVMRDVAAIAVLPLPGIFTAPGSFTTVAVPGQVIGRAIVTDSGKSALLFTTVAPVNSLTVLTLGSTPSVRTVALHAPVLAVFPTHDGENAIVLHTMTPTPGSDIEGAFSIVPVTQNLPALIQGLPAPPTSVALAPTSDFALVATRDDTRNVFGLYLGLMPSLQVVPYTLASPPTAVGIAAGAGRGYAAQDYSEGRITFVDLQGSSGCDAASCNSARTITGFELGARVVNGGTP